ncbi:MAG: hypothetical protein JJU29_20785, partial [Verrucomicrobia bacterium]|nr:hypothetical protein [Verrucomicrobiota bacterium]
MPPDRGVRAVGPSQYQPSPVTGAAQADRGTGLGFCWESMSMRAVGPHKSPGTWHAGDLRGLSARVGNEL